jgi:cytochrome d ubiquinol oxidase subunit II
LLGVAFADFLRGVQMNAAHDVTGGFFDLLSPYALLGWLTTLTLFALHGACFLVLRTEGDVALRAQRLTRVLAPLAGLLALAFVTWTSQVRGGAVSLLLAAALVLALLAAAVRGEHPARAFACTSTAAALLPVWVFAALYPDVLPARNGAALSLTLTNASSSHYTLVVMTVVAAIFLPVVLAYTAWTYWVFRARVTGDSVVGDGYGGMAHVVSSAAESAREVFGTHSDEPPVRT